MPYSTYEFINTSQQSLSNVFAASIQNSAFHWHKEYELIGILKGTITEQVQQETIVLREGGHSAGEPECDSCNQKQSRGRKPLHDYSDKTGIVCIRR